MSCLMWSIQLFLDEACERNSTAFRALAVTRRDSPATLTDQNQSSSADLTTSSASEKQTHLLTSRGNASAREQAAAAAEAAEAARARTVAELVTRLQPRCSTSVAPASASQRCVKEYANVKLTLEVSFLGVSVC